MLMHRSFLLVFALCVGALALPADARTWTDVNGETIEADFVGVKGKSVIVSIAGQRIALPYRSLSAEDKQFIREQMAKPQEREPLTEERLWTDREGQKVKASLVSKEDDVVVLKLASGALAPFPFAEFSDYDQEVIMAEVEGRERPLPPGITKGPRTLEPVTPPQPEPMPMPEPQPEPITPVEPEPEPEPEPVEVAVAEPIDNGITTTATYAGRRRGISGSGAQIASGGNTSGMGGAPVSLSATDSSSSSGASWGLIAFSLIIIVGGVVFLVARNSSGRSQNPNDI